MNNPIIGDITDAVMSNFDAFSNQRMAEGTPHAYRLAISAKRGPVLQGAFKWEQSSRNSDGSFTTNCGIEWRDLPTTQLP